MILAYSKASDGNMSFKFGDSKEVSENRKSFFQESGIDTRNIVEVKQVHGNKVILIEDIINPETVADGMITNKAGIYLLLKVADCIPISFYDHKHEAVGLVHAGSRGLEKGIIRKAITKMRRYFHTNPKDLIAKLGPSIGPCCYRKDIWQEAENQLIENGILKESIENLKICTYESEDYFSHRESEDKKRPEARFITILGLNAN